MQETLTIPGAAVNEEERPFAASLAAAPAETYDPDVRVIYGAGLQSMPLVGMSIAQVRDAVVAILDVDRRAPLLVNGRPARADYRVAPGDELEFVHHAGEKGCS